jgi:multidrug efflux pump
LELQDRGGVGHDSSQARDQLLTLARRDPNLTLVRANGLPDSPTFKIDIGREGERVRNQPERRRETFSMAGARAASNFLDTDGRIKKFCIRPTPHSDESDDLKGLYVRSGTWCDSVVRDRLVAQTAKLDLQRPFLVRIRDRPRPAVPDRRWPRAGLAKATPAGVGYEWTGISLQRQQSGSRRRCCTGFAPRCAAGLAALYELVDSDFSDRGGAARNPGALAARRRFTGKRLYWVGLLTTIGLSSRNAILIIRFAHDSRAQGKSIIDAAVEAAFAVAADP